MSNAIPRKHAVEQVRRVAQLIPGRIVDDAEIEFVHNLPPSSRGSGGLGRNGVTFLCQGSAAREGGGATSEGSFGNYVTEDANGLPRQETAGLARQAGPADLPRQKRAAGPGRPAWVLERGRDTSLALQDHGFDVIRTADIEGAIRSLSDGAFPASITACCGLRATRTRPPSQLARQGQGRRRQGSGLWPARPTVETTASTADDRRPPACST